MSRRNEKLYHIYYGIKQRCYNPKNTKYDIYMEGKGLRFVKNGTMIMRLLRNGH